MSVDIKDHIHYLQDVVPAAELSSSISGYPGYIFAYFCKLSTDEVRAVDVEHAKLILHTLGEQIRRRAIRDLGLEPMLRSYEKDISRLHQANNIMSQQLQKAHAKEAALQLEINELRERYEPAPEPESGAEEG